ncbi:hypothetical protein FNV43_RR18000 [Rhamnella rubrinervis]|uniref:DUF7642 domain-containing protein n=1 Tax=Rhamnella rubrinervis TaxID=2594499 RepID=A0A8K0GSG7_9ROSA|nr:hypothetical protein FNV43_RR18000 [Rhamnella rubrinervis]
MGSEDEVVEIDNLEKGLLSDSGSHEENEAEDERVLYTASFEEMEEKFVKYQTAQWVLYSLLLILAWGLGLFMLLYLPIRRYVLRKDIRSRKLYLTPDSIVYKVTKPVPFPCFGVLKKEKHIVLPSVADIVIEQGLNMDTYSLYFVYSLRIENVGVRRPPSDDVQIQGITDPSAFRKAVLMHLSAMRNEIFSRQVSTIEDVPNLMLHMSPAKSSRQDSFPHSGEIFLLQKLEEVGNSVKRVQTLIEEQRPQTSEPID